MIDAPDAPANVTLTPDELRVVFRRRYAKPIENVWAALTIAERLADWLAVMEIEPHAGGRIKLDWANGNTMEGKVLAYDPPTTFAFTWPLGGRDTEVRFELISDAGGCELTLTHSNLSPLPGRGAGVRAGWHAHLAGIPDALEGKTTPWDTMLFRKDAVESLYPPLA